MWDVRIIKLVAYVALGHLISQIKDLTNWGTAISFGIIAFSCVVILFYLLRREREREANNALRG